MTAGVLTGLALLLAAGTAVAPPAAAVDDPVRSDARVTHGPSCQPGGLVVEVTAGTSPYFVRLATTREPGGEDEATIVPGTTVVLRTGDVDWGETIDGRLLFEARDGSGDTYVDELDFYTFTRPTSEDCAAVSDPTQPHPPPPPGATGRGDAGILPVGADPAGGAPGGTAPDGTAPDGTAPDGTAPDGTAPDGTAPDGTAPDDVAVDVAASSMPSDDTDHVPPVAALGALLVVGGAVATTAGRQRRFSGSA